MAQVIAPRPSPLTWPHVNGIAAGPEPPKPRSTRVTKMNGATKSDREPRARNRSSSRPDTSIITSNPSKTSRDPGPNMAFVSAPAADRVAAQPPLDPISRQIIERTQSVHKVPQLFSAGPTSHAGSGPSEEHTARQGSDPGSIRRADSTASNRAAKDKKKGVSFLSRIMGGKKREDSFDLRDSASEVSESRPAGIDAEVFSQPVGFIPRFPPPPKYIKVKAQNRKEKDFDRLFLAQILLSSQISKGRKASVDSKIHSIDVPLQGKAQISPQSPTKAIWAMEFSKDGRYLAAAGQDKKLRVWEILSNADDRDGEDKELPSGNDENDVRLNAPVFKTTLAREYEGHTSSILDLSWSKNNFLLSSSMDKTVRLYHVSRAECLCAFKHNDFVTSIQFHPRDDRFFLAGSLDSKIRLWSIPDKSVAYWQQVPDMVTAVAFTPDGKTSIAGCLNGLCVLFDTEGLKAHSQIHVKSNRGRNSKGSKVTGIDTISIPRASGQLDVKLLITSNDSRVRMYNLKDRTLEVKFRGNENSCSQIHASFSDDGKYVICGSEDRKVYIWPTSPAERPDGDKRPVEVFEAHSTIVTSAVLAPTTTRRLLAQSGDPLYDLCNPPPVTLRSRADSTVSSRAPTHHSGNSDEKQATAPSGKSESPKRAPETPAYLARQSHPGGQIIVTADYTGQIKVFRQDCAYQKRRQESWDTGSTFSKKVLGRSGSVTTRNSVASSSHRNSLNFASKNPSADRILNWRNSISVNGNSASNSATEINSRQSLSNDSPGSNSPGKSWAKRLSLRHNSNLMANPPPSAIPTSNTVDSDSPPSISIQPPGTPDSPATFHSADDQTSSPRRPSARNEEASAPRGEGMPLPREPADMLFLVENQSYMAWDVEHTLLPMAKQQPRTPGLRGPDGNPISRSQSYVSQLSSEMMSSEGEVEGGDEEQADESRRPSVRSDGNDLECPNCKNDTFRTTMTEHGQKLRCKKCGNLL